MTTKLYEKALRYLNDIKLLNANIDSLINSKDNNEFEQKLLTVLKKLSVIELCAEYYDNSDCTERFLIVETGVKFVDFPEIEAKIAYDYAFTRGRKLSGCNTIFSYKQDYFEPADKAIEIIGHDLQKLEKKLHNRKDLL